MIHTLHDLIARQRSLAGRLPLLRDRLVIQGPGYPASEIVRLQRALPGMPASYTRVIEQVRIDNAALGYFALAPGSGPNLVDRLIERNTRGEAGNHWFKRDRVYHIANWEADPIAVARDDGSPFTPGAIVKYDSGWPDGRPAPLAPDFETMMLIAANLDVIREQYSDSQPSASGEPPAAFEAYLQTARLSQAEQDSWKAVATGVLATND